MHQIYVMTVALAALLCMGSLEAKPAKGEPANVSPAINQAQL